MDILDGIRGRLRKPVVTLTYAGDRYYVRFDDLKDPPFWAEVELTDEMLAHARLEHEAAKDDCPRCGASEKSAANGLNCCEDTDVAEDAAARSVSMDYIEYGHLLRRLHKLNEDGCGESDEAEAIADRMDGPWYRMSAREQDLARKMSDDLYNK